MSRKICKEIKYSEDEKKIISKCAEKRNRRIGTYIRGIAVTVMLFIYPKMKRQQIGL